MYEVFSQSIRCLHNLIIQPIDIMYKLLAINRCKNSLNIEIGDSFGSFYYRFVEKNKETGVVYTPLEMSEYIIKNTVNIEKIISNPFVKILDPACGCGNIVIPCYKYLKKVYIENLDEINHIHNINLTNENIDEHIIKNNIFGCDIDEVSIKVLQIDLFCESKSISTDNFFVSDFLLNNDTELYDFIIGNPPYVGHKSMEKDYSKKLKLRYKEIFRDKGDLSYCFFKRSIEKVNKGGKITFITSRYFIEAISGEGLRDLILTNLSIYKIVDFYGIRPFKNVGIDPIIIFLQSDELEQIEILKPVGTNKELEVEFYNSVFLDYKGKYKKFSISKEDLKDSWMLINNFEREIIEKVKNKCNTTLNDICDSYQGIITGCDRAFIVDNDTIKKNKIEPELIKPWIKSSDIKQFKVEHSNKYLIYSNLIFDETCHKNTIEHIGHFKDRLCKRRECMKGIRKWYELQWGRKEEVFKGEKIIFPYKAEKNRFALDNGSYFSADVYCLKLKAFTNNSHEQLLYILNSKLYEFYFKCYGKKLGGKLYEYYPNTLMKLPIPRNLIFKDFSDYEVYNYFELNQEQINYIEEQVIR